ncbi:hypothetical protein [Paenibacillus sp. Soil766]|uniref:hypothetical protein n=1 Tax=Paenibacillus sp. Soil766 TaxID=1736404 RepID=UPI0012F81C54|nr:hypothetical protein [Paenibacillus sp. Soil766]
MNQDRTSADSGRMEQFSQGFRGNSLTTAHALSLQRTIGNRAVGHLMQSKMQSSRPSSGPSEGIQIQATQQAAIQRRAIPQDVYNAYDSEKKRNSTKLMLQASAQEDSLIQWVNEAKNHMKEIRNLGTDEMVKDTVTTSLRAMMAKQGEITLFKKASVTTMTAIIEAYKTDILKPKPEIPRSVRGMQRRLQELANDKVFDDNIKTNIENNVAQVQEKFNQAQILITELSTFVKDLQKELADKKKGKTNYDKMKDSHVKANEDDLFTSAGELGIAVPDDISTETTSADEKASNKQWIEAGESASKSSQLIDKLRSQVSSAKANKNKFEELSIEFPNFKKVTLEFARLKIQDDDGDLGMMNDCRQKAQAEFRNKNWAEAKNLAQKAIKLAKKLEGLADLFRNYADGDRPKLLQGTLLKIFQKLSERPSYTNSEALDYMENIHTQQCAVKRENWLTYLGIAGENIVGVDSDHYTTFNDSVPPNATFSVKDKTKEEVCDELFGINNEMKRLHSTRVVGASRYHRYLQKSDQAAPIYSANVLNNNLRNTNAAAFNALNERYNTMRTHMLSKVEEAIKLHGRVGTNDRGQQLTFP